MPYKARTTFYKMYTVLDRAFRPYVDFLRKLALDFFPDLKEWIGQPPGYRPPKATTRAKRASSTKRTRPKSTGSRKA